MIAILIKTLLTLVLILGILIVIVGTTWVLSLMINEMLEVDILWKLKEKARKCVYGKTMGGMFERRNRRSRSDRDKTKAIKRALLQRRDNSKGIQEQSNETTEES